MRKFIGILLICFIFFSGCRQADPASGNASSTNPNSSSVGSASDQQNNPTSIDNPAPTAEILSAQPFDPLIQVGNTVVALPATYESLISAGAENVDTKYNDTYLVDAGAYHIVSFGIGDTQVKMGVHNDTDDLLQIKDCTIKSISSTQGPALFYPGGVHVGMTLDELTTAWGPPSEDLSESHEDTLSYSYLQYPFDHNRFDIVSTSIGGGASLISATGNSYTVSISRNTSQVINISRTLTEGVGSDALFEDSKEFRNGLTGESTFLLYSLPENLYRNAYTMGGRRISALTVGEEVYIITIDIPSMALTLQAGDTPLSRLSESINIAYPHEIKVLLEEDETACVTGYLIQDNVLYAAGGFVGNGSSYMSYDTRMIPLDPEGTITPAAQAAFEELFDAFVLSMHISA